MLCSPRPLAADDQLDGFDCGKASLSEWLVRHARQAHASGSARTFAVVDNTNGGHRIRKGMGQYPIPVVLLGRLAVDQRHQRQGIGPGLLRDAITRALTISEHADVRAMMTHPLDADAANFYLNSAS